MDTAEEWAQVFNTGQISQEQYNQLGAEGWERASEAVDYIGQANVDEYLTKMTEAGYELMGILPPTIGSEYSQKVRVTFKRLATWKPLIPPTGQQ